MTLASRTTRNIARLVRGLSGLARGGDFGVYLFHRELIETGFMRSGPGLPQPLTREILLDHSPYILASRNPQHFRACFNGQLLLPEG
jgi:hypothetical protein